MTPKYIRFLPSPHSACCSHGIANLIEVVVTQFAVSNPFMNTIKIIPSVLCVTQIGNSKHRDESSPWPLLPLEPNLRGHSPQKPFSQQQKESPRSKAAYPHFPSTVKANRNPVASGNPCRQATRPVRPSIRYANMGASEGRVKTQSVMLTTFISLSLSSLSPSHHLDAPCVR